MYESSSRITQQVAQATIACQKQWTGHAPEAVTLVLSADTLVITLHDALSPAEKALALNPAGAVQMQEFHPLFVTSCEEVRQEIDRITGVEVREAAGEFEMVSGALLHTFTTGAMVQVFLPAESVRASAWSGNGFGNAS
jgi:uncharacterized protein YbcI